MAFYRLIDGKAEIGAISLGDDWIEYRKGKEPQELLDAMQISLNIRRVSEINARLIAIDAESVRPLRAVSGGTQTSFDIDKLNALDIEADELRAERLNYVEPTI